MRLDVVIPTWRRPEELARCLDGLAAQIRTPEAVMVVARPDDEETAALLTRPRDDGLRVRTVDVEDRGVVKALHRGIAACEGEVVAITDDDSVPRPDWLERIEAAFAGEPAPGGVGGRDHVHEAGGELRGERHEVGYVRAFGRVVGNHHLGAGAAREVDLLKGVNMAFLREAIVGVPFGEGLRGGGAQVHWEADLCLAVKARGWRLVYDPAIAVDHYPAPRHGSDQRVGRSVDALADEVFNLTLVLLRRLPAWRGAAALSYGLLIGTRQAPGLVVALERAVRGRPAWRALGACERARLQAARSVLGTLR